MYKIPKLLKPPHKQTEELQRMQNELRKSLPPQKQEEKVVHKSEFIVEKDLDENDFIQFIPQKQEPQPIVQQPHYQPKNYLEEFFDQKGIAKREAERKKKMVQALNHELEKNEQQINEMLQDFEGYQNEINTVQEKVKILERDGKNMALLQKLEVLDGNLNEAINLEIKEEFKLNPDDEEIDDKLNLMYDDTNNIIEQYEQLKQQILEEEQQRLEDQEEKALLEELDEKQLEDRRLQLELQQRIEQVRNEGVKLQMERKLQMLKESTLQRTEMKKVSITNYSKRNKKDTKPKSNKAFSGQKQYNMYQQQFGYGKDKITFKPL